MSNNISIGPLFGNLETEMRLTFGSNVSASRVISFVKRNAEARAACGLISDNEASEMVRQTEEKLKQLQMM